MDNPFLTRLRRLTQLNEAERVALEQTCGEPRHARAKADLVREGEQSERLHVLLDGWACRFKLLRDGRRQITALILPGEICDLDSLYVQRSDYAVATLTACTVATIDRKALRDLAAQHPGIAEALGFLIAIDNAMLTERGACLGRRSAREHLAHFLCELLMRLTVVGQARGSGYMLPVTQEEIGDVLGLTAVHVNRVLNGLRNDGIIDQKGQNLVISEWSVLRQIAGFRPDYLHLDHVDGSAFDFTKAPWALQAQRSDPVGPRRAWLISGQRPPFQDRRTTAAKRRRSTSCWPRLPIAIYCIPSCATVSLTSSPSPSPWSIRRCGTGYRSPKRATA